ncbi:glycoside hydrolase family 97 N-terminal domain-containing protein [Microbacterium sp. P06]|uniref:glycoside hydrolase family 97 N-terminal domain-containing protein n=1 Tax=Microbacterium sp. P06 TaxID=3366949 RepID=UPI003745F66E
MPPLLDTPKRRLPLFIGAGVATAVVAAGVITATLLGGAASALEGAGTAETPYVIDDAAEFSTFIQTVNADTAGTGAAAAHYELGADIALTAPVPMMNTFSGVLDGAGHTVFGLTIDYTTSAAFQASNGTNKTAALINAQRGTVERIGFSQVSISGSSAAETQTTATKKATVAAHNHGLIDQVYVVGSVDGGWRTGGIVADNMGGGTIQNSYFRGSVTSGWETGGITARNDNAGVQKITNVYVSGAIATGTRNIGMVAGYSYSNATIRGAVALDGSVTQGSGQSTSNIGRVNGQNNTSVGGKGASYADNLALDTLRLTTGTAANTVTGTATDRQGLGKTAAELTQRATYEAIGWDFDRTWRMDAATLRPHLSAVAEKTEPTTEPTIEPTIEPTPTPTPTVTDLTATSLVTSPDGKTVATVSTDATGELSYSVTQDGKTIVRDSALGLVVDGVDWGAAVTLGAAATSSTDETYPLIGLNDSGRDHRNTSVIPLVRGDGSLVSVEIRAFDTGIAVRYVLDPSLAGKVVSREDTAFAFDPASTLTYQPVTASTIDDLQNSFSRASFDGAGDRDITVLPTVETPDGHFANITEANILDWPAIALKTTRGGVISTYYWATDNKQGTFAVTAASPYSPFRVVTIADNLTDFTNSDIVTAVNPAVDASVFPGGDTSWIEPGTNAWSTLTTNDQSVAGMQKLLDDASAARIPGILIEGNLTHASWGTTTAERFANIAALVDRGESKAFPVSVWLWTDYDKAAGVDSTFTSGVTYDSGSAYPQVSLQNPDLRDAYLDLVSETGIAGTKVDHTNEETETKVNFFRDFARDSAAEKLMVIYHNPLEPTGLNRTYPNELGREAIKGLQSGYSANQQTLAPFSRMIAGTADYTPFLLSGAGGNVTWAHQLASTVVYSMPFLQLSERPDYLAPGGQYHDIAGDVIANLPTTWKQSRMLPQSDIGSLTAVVRETSDGEFWVAVTSGSTAPGEMSIPLDFLPAGTTYNADVYADKTTSTAMSRTVSEVDASSTLTASVRSGGGFVARITTEAIDNPLGEGGANGYTIDDEADLALIAQHPMATFTLTADITLTKPWAPVPLFMGTIEGKGHKISGLEVEGGASKAFIVNNSGVIRQLGFVDPVSTVPAPYVQTTRVAVVAVANAGLIDEVFVRGAEVSGGWRTAPIAAENTGEVRSSYTVDAKVVSNWEAGGLVAFNSATGVLTKNYVAGADVKAEVQNGGILSGYGYAGTQVRGNVVLSGSVTTANNPRARILARENGVPTYTDNLSLATATVNGAAVTGGTASNRNGADRTADELATASTYEGIGWDLAGVWEFDAEKKRPVLRAVSETVAQDPSTASQQVQVAVPLIAEGEFVWSVDGSNAPVDMGEAVQGPGYYEATGEIHPIRVTDTRRAAGAWSISAQVSDFTGTAGTFGAEHLGWTPKVIDAGAGARAGVAIAPAFDGGAGLAVSATLGSADAGHELGSARLGADLLLKLPVEVANGTYRATMTLTALG